MMTTGIKDRLVALVREYLRPHYLLHVRLDEMDANTYINKRIGKWAADNKKNNSRIVLIQAWKISTKEYLQIRKNNE